MHQQLWGYKVEEKLYLGVSEQKKVEYHCSRLTVIKTNIYICISTGKMHGYTVVKQNGDCGSLNLQYITHQLHRHLVAIQNRNTRSKKTPG
jgi:hypothetical protein